MSVANRGFGGKWLLGGNVLCKVSCFVIVSQKAGETPGKISLRYSSSHPAFDGKTTN